MKVVFKGMDKATFELRDIENTSISCECMKIKTKIKYKAVDLLLCSCRIFTAKKEINSIKIYHSFVEREVLSIEIANDFLRDIIWNEFNILDFIKELQRYMLEQLQIILNEVSENDV